MVTLWSVPAGECGVSADPGPWSEVWSDAIREFLTPDTCIDETTQEWISDSVLAPFVDDIRRGVGDTVKALVTFWINVPDPNVGDPVTGVPSDAVAFLSSSVAPIAGILMVLAIIIGAGKTMIDAKRSGEEFKAIGLLLVRYMFTAGLTVPVVASLLLMSKAFAQWILERSTQGTSFVDNLFGLFDSTEGVTSAIALFVVLLIAMIVAAIQCLVMIFRGAVLLILTGTILLSVSMSNLDAGKEAFRKHGGWIVGWILYAPAAAIVYSAGFRLLGTDTAAEGNGLLECLYGIAIMLMAIFALPAILRLVVPATAPVAAGRGTGAAMAAAAATAVPMAAMAKR